MLAPIRQRSWPASMSAAPPGVHPLWLAQSRLLRRRFDECIAICTGILALNPLDQAAWFLKCRAIAQKSWVDDSEVALGDGEVLGDLLLEEGRASTAARPGTSLLHGPLTGATAPATSAAAPRAATPARAHTGFARPGTGAAAAAAAAAAGAHVLAAAAGGGGGFRRGGGGGGGAATALLDAALRTARPATGSGRPMTASGRLLRLGTASLASAAAGGEPGGGGGGGAAFIRTARLDLRKYAARPALGRALFQYILHVDGDVRAAVELAAAGVAATKSRADCGGAASGDALGGGDDGGGASWWWRCALGKCYALLGLTRDAVRQFQLSLEQQHMASTALQLGAALQRLDQPTAALEVYLTGAQRHPADLSLPLAAARLQGALGDAEAAAALHRQVLSQDPGNEEAVACAAAHYFHEGQPELALRFYRRLAQMGVNSTELWANLGLCCWEAGQHDMVVPCLLRALDMADDAAQPDVWYNIGHVALRLGDLAWAQQAWQVALALCPGHPEALNNLAVLKARQGKRAEARSLYRSAQQLAPCMHEAWYNAALLAWREGDLQGAHDGVHAALAAWPEHGASLELSRLVRERLAAVW